MAYERLGSSTAGGIWLARNHHLRTSEGDGDISCRDVSLVQKGRLMKVWRGVFRMTAYPSQGMVSDMTAFLALFGDGAYLCRESVLALYGPCPTRSYVASVAVSGRMWKQQVPQGTVVVKAERVYKPIYYDGIACQRPADAIRSCIGILEKSRLIEAVDEVENKGYFMPSESNELRKKIENGKATA